MFRRLLALPGKSLQGRTGGAYTVTEQDADVVRQLSDLPQSSIGAPLPTILAGEFCLAIAYLCELPDANWDGSYVRVVSAESEGETICVVSFDNAIAHFFGPPNDEAFSGHPLADRGLKPYGTFEITSSSWIRALERMNSVHPHHKPELFSGYRHFVLSFHDTTFECVAAGYTFQTRSGRLQDVMGDVCASL